MGKDNTHALSLGVRWDAVLNFQSLMSRARPGSRLFEIADKAIDLALRPSRPTNDARFFRRNVWRNAAHTVARTERMHPEISLNDLSVGAATTSLADTLIGPVSPLELVATDDLQSKIALRSEHSSPGIGRLCAERMAAGDSVMEIAEDGSKSLRTVKRVRARVRVIASELLRDRAA